MAKQLCKVDDPDEANLPFHSVGSVCITQLAAQEPVNDSSNTASQMTFQDIDVDAAGKVLYRGRIDDRRQDYGLWRKRPTPTTNDLHDALSIARPETKAVGYVFLLRR